METTRHRRSRASRAATGLAAGALLGAALLGVFALGTHLGVPNVAFTVFEWLTRVLPGRLVIFGLEATLHVLEAVGLSIKDASKTTEEAIALTEVFVASAAVGAVTFAVWRPAQPVAARRRGLVLGAVAGVLLLAPVVMQSGPLAPTKTVLAALWTLVVLLLWGWVLGWVFSWVCPRATPADEQPRPEAQARPEVAAPVALPAPVVHRPPDAPATDLGVTVEAERMDRRHFLVRMGGMVATFVVLGAEVGELLRVAGGPPAQPLTRAPIPFPNADSPVKPVPGTRPEYTPVAQHYRVDIDLTPPSIDVSSWALSISGLVASPVKLTIDQLRNGYAKRDQFVTLECISNPVAGPLIGTTLWSGPSLKDVLATARPQAQAHYAHILAQDGFDEVVALSKVDADPRVILAYDWNGEPLPTSHGFPLRVYVPDLYGMKQPKWITDIVLVPDFLPGYWVKRGWDKMAVRRTTSVIDTVATGDLVHRGARTFVPVGGIADAGARGVSRVQVQIDGGPWQDAELRKPLSELTWTIWRYEWPWQEGQHTFAVRAYDGAGSLQTATSHDTYPSGATGIDTKSVNVLPG
jgi:DMSO/TMAO reductase YedYZ molybdopterin-dependent catalytic subunit